MRRISGPANWFGQMVVLRDDAYDATWMIELHSESVAIIRQKPRARASGYTIQKM